MAKEIRLDELLERQRQMAAKAASLVNEKDVERISAVTAELEREGRELEALAKEFERQELAKAGPPPQGKLEVVLTDAQRARVKNATGVDMTSVVVPDEAGVLAQAMPATDPRDIERMAMLEGKKRAAVVDADAKMRVAVAEALRNIEEQGMGETRAELEKLKADPSWLGGILQKK
jgi:hypothetical protein